MATGRLGAVDLNSTSEVVLYTVPESIFTVATVNLVNRTSGEVRVRVALSATNTPTASEWLEFDVLIQANGVLERTGIVLDADKRIVVRSDTAGVTALAYGIETRSV